MAKGDARRSSPSRGGWGSASSTVYDDEGRGHSKTLYEAFENAFLRLAKDKIAWLQGNPASHNWAESLGDDGLLKCVENMVSRYGIHDWAWNKFADDERNDGRVRRLVIKHCGQDAWLALQERAKRVFDANKEKMRQYRLQQDAERGQQQAAFEAERIIRQQQLAQQIVQRVELVRGEIASDMALTFRDEDVYNQDGGDYLDDVVDAVTSGYGFATEVKKSDGVKLQITVALDLSNSMLHNGVHDAAAAVFFDIYSALEVMSSEYDGRLFVGAFEFAKDGYDDSDCGRIARCLTVANGVQIRSHISDTGAYETPLYNYRPDMSPRYMFTGEDTWLYPLFACIEEWECAHSDPGAFRIDLVITDAVIEHPTDIRHSDKIQERRDGALQTVFLNLLPASEWVNSDLPLRCVQYAVNPDNIGGLLRKIIAEFVGAHL